MPLPRWAADPPADAQGSLFCACGRRPTDVAGCCRPCYHARWRSARRFAGNRERALARDGQTCCGCGARHGLIVHHRQPGVNHTALLATLCRACHAAVHHRSQPSGWWPARLGQFWDEQHAGAPRQLALWEPGAAALARAA